jgi:uncharacterized protein (UPF0332 family)
MTPEALDLWQRASRGLQTAQGIASEDPDASASRSYYAAFYAVSALFALEGKSYSKHTGVEAAVHREPGESRPVNSRLLRLERRNQLLCITWAFDSEFCESR